MVFVAANRVETLNRNKVGIPSTFQHFKQAESTMQAGVSISNFYFGQ